MCDSRQGCERVVKSCVCRHSLGFVVDFSEAAENGALPILLPRFLPGSTRHPHALHQERGMLMTRGQKRANSGWSWLQKIASVVSDLMLMLVK